MIFVAGTKRSGTSMWMQVLIAAGFPHIGDAFPGPWRESIGAANPRGFFESELRMGVYYASNPHPRTGVFLRPEQTRRHVVKVFLPGLVRTDFAFLDHVVATMRHPGEYVASLSRLKDLETDYWEGRSDKPQAQWARKPPPDVEWWLENFELLRDVAVRRYPIHLTAYDRLLEDPERVLRTVLSWLGEGDLQAAVEAVDASLRTQLEEKRGSVLTDEEWALALELYEHVRAERPVPAALLGQLNEAHAGLLERLRPQDAE